MGTPVSFSTIFSKGSSFCVFLIASLYNEALPGSTPSEFYPLRVDPINPIALRTAKTLRSFDRSMCNRVKKGGKHKNDRVDSPTSVPTHLNSISESFFYFSTKTESHKKKSSNFFNKKKLRIFSLTISKITQNGISLKSYKHDNFNEMPKYPLSRRNT